MLPNAKSTQNCARRMLDINATPFDPYVSQIEKNFEKNPAYMQVYRNLDFTQSYKAWIEEGTAPDKIVPYKQIGSYPYPTPQFEIGDFVSFPYGKNPMSHWLLETLDSQVYYNVIGRLIPLNQEVKFRNGAGVVLSTYVSFQDKFNYTNFKHSTSGVTIPSGMARLITQQNEVTDLWGKNTRLIIGSVVFKIQQNLRQLNNRYVEFFITEDAEVPADDFVNGIAWNEYSEPQGVTGIVISPDIFEILQGTSQSYSVYYYKKGIVQPDTFSIEVSGVPVANYTIATTDNGFIITNLKWSNALLTVVAKDDVTGESSTMQIRLASEY